MKEYDHERRQFLKLAISLPIAFVIGCDLERKPEAKAPILNPEESLKKLIFVLGPWSAKDKEKAEDFAKRFLKVEYVSSAYLQESSELVQSLASRFTAESIAIKEIDLRSLTKEEQKLLIILVQQLYSFVEVRFYVSNEPPWGECQGSNKWHTQNPRSGKS